MKTLLFLLTLSSVAPARAIKFDFRDVGARNLVQFVSDAQIEKTVGISSAVTGWLEVDPDKLSSPGVRGELEVDLRTFQTGTALKDDFLRDRVLLAAEYPTGTLSITRLVSASRPKLQDNVPVTLKLEGTLSVRGVARNQAVVARLVYFRESELTRQRLPGNLLRMSATLEIDTTKLNAVSEADRARYARVVQIAIDAVGTDQTPAQATPVIDPVKPRDSKSPSR